SSPARCAAVKGFWGGGTVGGLRTALKGAGVVAGGPVPRGALRGELGPHPAVHPRLDRDAKLKDVVQHVVENTERELILRTLERTRWNRTQAARILGINYKTLQGKLKQYRLPERGATPDC